MKKENDNRASTTEWRTTIGKVLIFAMSLGMFMIQGLYGPQTAEAITYYMGRDTATNLTADGTCNVTGLTPYTSSTQPGKTTTLTTDTAGASRYYPVVTAGTTTTVLKVYSPVYSANAVDISAISASAAMRGVSTSDTVKLDLYDYDPAGAANNGTLVASTSAAKPITSTTGQVQYIWSAGDFTIIGTGRVAQGHRLQFRFTYYSLNAGNPRFYFGATGALTSTNFTVTETPVSAIVAPTVTTPTAVSITNTTATLGANVTSDGGAALTARGTVWGTAAAPTGNAAAEGGTTMGVFTHGRTALTAGTRLFYRGYATNSAGTGYSPDGSFYTEPTTQASAVSFPSVTTTGMTVSWTRGSGNGVIVLMRSGAAVATDPTDGTYTTYTASTVFGSGTAIGAGFVVYKGTGTSVAVTGLTQSTTYHAAVYEYAGTVNTAGSDQGTNYKPTAAIGNQTTSGSASPPSAPTGISLSGMMTGGPTITWNTVSGATTYSVYRSTDGSTWGSTIGGAGAPTTTYSDNSAPKPNTVYYWTVTASNADGESTIPPGVSGRTALYKGYNMVSAPYNTTGQAPAVAFGSWADWNWIWNSSSNVDPDNSGTWDTPLEVSPGKGMFLWAYDESTVINASGSANPAALTITLVPGWNMVSNQTLANMSNIGASWMVDGSTPLTTAVSGGTIGGALSWWDGAQYQTLLISGSPVIEPWKAYFILNQTGVNHTLTIQ